MSPLWGGGPLLLPGSAIGRIEVVMTSFFQHPQPPTFARTANQMTQEMGTGQSGLGLECPGMLWGGLMVCAEECWCAPGCFPPAKGLIDDGCALETCLLSFWLVRIDLSVC